MDEVHCVSNILEHASVGHEQVAVLVTCREAGGKSDEVYPTVHLMFDSNNSELRGKKLGNSLTNGRSTHSLCVSGASGEEVHKAGVEIRLCRVHGNRSANTFKLYSSNFKI